MAGGKSKVFAVTPNESSRKGAKERKGLFPLRSQTMDRKIA
jgi:hypothetical protein